jgi:riboflavin synthase
MFTGLVAERGRIEAYERTADGVVLTVAAALARELKPGDSVAVNGVCLTASSVIDGRFAAEVMHATLEHTSLSQAATGSAVNLELPLRAGERMGGHIVQGHVDGVGRVAGVTEDGFARRLRIEAEPELLRYVVAKGSIALDGVSLTVVDCTDQSFTVSLIPETLERTSLGAAELGTRVNLEVDVVAKYVEKMVTR